MQLTGESLGIDMGIKDLAVCSALIKSDRRAMLI